MPEDRKLAAIMFTDIVGYTALMGKDSEKAFELLGKNRQVHRSTLEKHGGKWLKEMGDGILAQFDSAIAAVRSALEIQKRAKKELNARLRIGIHLGDIIIKHGDVFGDGVNIASRLQALADPGGIYISDSIEHAIRGNTDIHTKFLGALELKNVDYLVNTHFLTNKGLPAPSMQKRRNLLGKPQKSILKSTYNYISGFINTTISNITRSQKRNNNGHDLKAIAVLPVENLSENLDQEWLAAGIHHALIDELSKIHAFRVVSRTSTLKFRETDLTVPEIARELNVNGILEASFFTAENNINIQVRLIQAIPEERQIWRHDYDREMKNVLSIYNDVAKAVAYEANITLSTREKKYLSGTRQVNPKAYEAYLRGMSHVENATKVDLEKAMDYFQLACEIDPEYALTYVGISFVWVSYIQHGFMSFNEAEPKREKAVRKALELDSELVEIHTLMAINYANQGDWINADLEYRKAIDINPSYAIAQVYYAHYLAVVGRPIEGLTHSYLATELDPFNDLIQSVHAMALKNARKYDEALELLHKLLKTEPNHGIGLPTLWAVYHEKGNFNEALDVAKKIYSLKQYHKAIKALEAGYKEGGYKMAMQRTAEAMITYRDTAFFPPWQICTLYSRAVLKDEALEWLEMAIEERDNNVIFISVDPLFDFLREEPRFKKILQKMNLPEIQFPLK